MSSTVETPQMKAMRLAIAGEVRAIMARKDINGSEVAREMGVEQTWFSRRYSGKVAWSAAELKLVMDIADDDITRVYAAAAAALDAAGPTNPCLSDSARVGSEHLSGWAARGLDLAKKLYPALAIDTVVSAA